MNIPKEETEKKMLQRRTFNKYADVLYRVQALAFVVYPYHRTRNWMEAVYETAGIIVASGEEPTMLQLYAVEGFLLNELQEVHEGSIQDEGEKVA